MRVTIKTIPTITIAAMIAMVEIAKYISVGGCEFTGWAVAVGAGSSTLNDVTALDG